MIRPLTDAATPDRVARPGLEIPYVNVKRVSILIVLLLVAASWTFILGQDRTHNNPVFSSEALQRTWDFLKDLLGIGAAEPPAFAKLSEWQSIAPLAYKTLAMSVLGIGFAGLVALGTFIFGAYNVMAGELAPYRGAISKWIFLIVRGFFIVTRAIPELIWALIIAFLFSPGILAGAAALAIHNSGILGKLAAEVVEGLDPRPMKSLRSNGAGRFQVLLYGVLPQALPKFMTFLLYRWEVIIRTTIVVGFVAAGGLGMEFRLNMSHFHYTSVTLILIWYLLLVLFVDLAATGLRKLAR